MIRLKEGIIWAQRWEKSPMYVHDAKVILNFDPMIEEPISRSILVNTPEPTELKINIQGGNGLIKTQVQSVENSSQIDQVSTRYLVVLTVDKPLTDLEAVLRIESVDNPQAISTIALSLRRQ